MEKSANEASHSNKNIIGQTRTGMPARLYRVCGYCCYWGFVRLTVGFNPVFYVLFSLSCGRKANLGDIHRATVGVAVCFDGDIVGEKGAIFIDNGDVPGVSNWMVV